MSNLSLDGKQTIVVHHYVDGIRVSNTIKHQKVYFTKRLGNHYIKVNNRSVRVEWVSQGTFSCEVRKYGEKE